MRRRAEEVSGRTRLREVYRHPLGRDIVDSLAHQTGLSRRLVTSSPLGWVRIGALPRLSRGAVDAAFVRTLVDLLNAHRDVPSEGLPLREAWFKEAVFYQVYPRSFQDSDGDGIGDLRGILHRLDHLKDLGVDALWLSPIYDSPGDDNGYDIRDYRRVLAEFGTMADFDALVAGLRERGMRLVMDLVVNHTSDEHEWFREALADPDSPYRGYYFFREGTAEAPPNNWRSFFSGSAWRWFPEERVWVLHLFSGKQMDLDWSSPAMRADVIDMIRWWRQRGVDGFRLDVINLISKAPGLPDGAPAIGAATGFAGLEHYFHGPRLHEHLRQLRAEGFDDPDCVAIGETPAIGLEMSKLMVGDDRGELDMVFNFDQLENDGKTRWDEYRYDLRQLKAYYTRWQAELGDGFWMSLFFDNHDNPRMVSKVDPRPEHRVAVAKLLAMIQFTLRGTPFLYQGQEIGAVNQRFAGLADIRDVESLNLAAELAAAGAGPADVFTRILAGTRDHARVPMAWDASHAGGFTTGEPWLPGDGSHASVNVAAQTGDPASVLEWHRRLIALRRASRTLVYGTTVTERSPRGVWRYRRADEQGEWLVVLNLTDRTQRARRPLPPWEFVMGSGPLTGRALAPYEAQLWRRRR
ncbi:MULTISPECIES: alpha-glucosidase [unclassified Microbacterium]|uniref:glycoside hydrolase family 13 protein n=1 Tax=unclassified Microbacterium TaxID=2609290 RepID=UPI000A7F2E42|nr:MULTISPECIES: alpha-glucosidase [unclassified Microbacterium]MBN9225338.1 alpha-glucosidase [Microbacterium sp.]